MPHTFKLTFCLEQVDDKGRKELSFLKVGLAELSRKIEQQRNHLHELVKERRFTDPIVIRASRKLDEMLNQYERLVREKRRFHNE
jgi:16S rRNA G527 N7-methylase RsmG